MQNKLVDKIYTKCKEKNLKIRKIDIELYLKCQEEADYTLMHETNLYKKRGGDYCRMLEIVSWIEEEEQAM